MLPCLTAVSRPRLRADGPAPASCHLLPGRSRQTPTNGPRTFLPRADRAGCGTPHASHGPAAGPGASVPPLSPGRCGLYKACKTTPARSPLGRAGGRAACQAFPAPGSRASPSEAPGRGGPDRADTPHLSPAGRDPAAPGVSSVHRLGSPTLTCGGPQDPSPSHTAAPPGGRERRLCPTGARPRPSAFPWSQASALQTSRPHPSRQRTQPPNTARLPALTRGQRARRSRRAGGERCDAMRYGTLRADAGLEPGHRPRAARPHFI